MFIKINVQVHSSFGRTDTMIQMLLFTRKYVECFACCHCSASRTSLHFVVLHLKSGRLDNQDIEFGLRYVQNIIKQKVFQHSKG